MGKIQEKFETLIAEKKKALIPFFTAFYPSLNLFKDFLITADKAGADFIEIGIPFSDPLADGKTIQYSSQWALERDFSFDRLLKEIAGIKLNSSLIFMSYFNTIYQRGIENFGKEMEEAGIDGIIVPDLSLEESISFKEVLSKHNIDLIYLLAPTSAPERIKKISENSEGFIYLVSLTGVTGARDKLPENLVDYVNKVREITSKPLCVGFGISTPAQAVEVSELADGVIIGSALINLIKGKEEETNITKELENLLIEMRRVI